MRGTGFESTLQFADFMPGTGLGEGSTPIVPHAGPLQPLQAQAGDLGVEDAVRFYRQANGEGARDKVIQERLPGMVFAGSSGQNSVIAAPTQPRLRITLCHQIC